HVLRALKREELVALDSIALHELYFESLGGDGKLTAPVTAALVAQFGSVEAWRNEFIASARSLRGGSGWALLVYSRRDRQLYNHVAFDHTQALIDASPILALDMYEHAYQIDFGANAAAYIDAFMRNIDWTVVERRLAEVRDSAAANAAATENALPSVSIE